MNTILQRDDQTGIQCGINGAGDLFIGDAVCWRTMPDTPENREMLLLDWCYSVDQKKEAQKPPKVMQAGEWLAVDYKFQTNAAHVAAIYDELERKLKERSRARGEIPAFLDGVKTALRIVSANSGRVLEWCHAEEFNRNLGE